MSIIKGISGDENNQFEQCLKKLSIQIFNPLIPRSNL